MNEMRILYNDDNRDGEDACKPDGGEDLLIRGHESMKILVTRERKWSTVMERMHASQMEEKIY